MLIPAQNSNKANYKIQDCFANRQIKEDVKCNRYYLTLSVTDDHTDFILMYVFYIPMSFLFVDASDDNQIGHP
jgi:hypothetical protein